MNYAFILAQVCIYFAYDGATILLLLAGGDKSTQKADIMRAKKYFQDSLEAKHEKR